MTKSEEVEINKKWNEKNFKVKLDGVPTLIALPL